MPKQKQFTHEEIVKVWRMKATGSSTDEIAQELGRSASGVYKVLSRGDNFHAAARPGRPRGTSTRNDRQIIRLAATQTRSLRQIVRDSGLPISKDTVHRRLRSNSNIVLAKMRKLPLLTKAHKQARLDWAKEHMSWQDEWISVIFSDEKNGT